MKLNNKIDVENKVCFSCMSKNVKIKHVETQLDGQNGWLDVSYFLPYIYCKNEKCNDVQLAPEASVCTHKAVCAAQEILSASQIKEIRKDYQSKNKASGTNAEHFAEYMKLGLSTVLRWESGSSYINKHSDMFLKMLASDLKPSEFFNKKSSTIDSDDVLSDRSNVYNFPELSSSSPSEQKKIMKDKDKFAVGF